MSRPYTEHDEQVIVNSISKMPTNLSLAFEEAGRILKRKGTAVSGHYYQHMKKSSRNIMVTGTKDVMIINSKSTRRPDETVSFKDIISIAIPKMTKKEKMTIIEMLMS